MRSILSSALFSVSAFLILISPLLAQANSAQQCGSDNVSNVRYWWCIERGEPGSRDVLYYLHGGGGSEKSWSQDPVFEELRKAWKKIGAAKPTVISVSYGPTWLLSEVSGLHEVHVGSVLPRLEAKIGGVKGRRLLMGDAMGGFNSAMLIVKNGELFDRVALLCPAILTIGPQATQKEISSYFARHKKYVIEEWVLGLLDWKRTEFPKRRDWQAHDPIELAGSLNSHAPKIYVSCGNADEHGFFEGAGKFAQIAASTGANVTWHPLSGQHCTIDTAALARFLAP